MHDGQHAQVMFYYIDTDEIPGIFLLLRTHIFMRTVKILFLSFSCEEIGVAMVTIIISQLQESFPFRCAASAFEISLTK